MASNTKRSAESPLDKEKDFKKSRDGLDDSDIIQDGEKEHGSGAPTAPTADSVNGYGSGDGGNTHSDKAGPIGNLTLHEIHEQLCALHEGNQDGSIEDKIKILCNLPYLVLEEFGMIEAKLEGVRKNLEGLSYNTSNNFKKVWEKTNEGTSMLNNHTRRLGELRGDVEGAVEVAKHMNDVKDICFSVEHLMRDMSMIKRKQIDLELEVKKRTIVITGVSEEEEEDPKITANNIFKEINQRISIDDIDDAYRRGKINRKSKWPRPLVVTLLKVSVRDYLLQNSERLNHKSDYEKIFLNEEIPYEIRKSKNKMRSIVSRAQDAGIDSKIVGNDLLIDGIKFKHDELDLIPENLIEEEKGLRLTKKGYIFAGPDDFLSNFYEAPLEYEGNKYTHVEQAWQYLKAIKHERFNVAEKIMNCSIPHLIKARGDKVKRENEEWLRNEEKLMKELVLIKFTSNPKLEQLLIETGGHPLLEATNDPVWGCGLSKDSKVWKRHGEIYINGKNLLGKILMQVRHEICAAKGIHIAPVQNDEDEYDYSEYTEEEPMETAAPREVSEPNSLGNSAIQNRLIELAENRERLNKEIADLNARTKHHSNKPIHHDEYHDLNFPELGQPIKLIQHNDCHKERQQPQNNNQYNAARPKVTKQHTNQRRIGNFQGASRDERNKENNHTRYQRSNWRSKSHSGFKEQNQDNRSNYGTQGASSNRYFTPLRNNNANKNFSDFSVRGSHSPRYTIRGRGRGRGRQRETDGEGFITEYRKTTPPKDSRHTSSILTVNRDDRLSPPQRVNLDERGFDSSSSYISSIANNMYVTTRR